jgi:hypothetical protein
MSSQLSITRVVIALQRANKKGLSVHTFVLGGMALCALIGSVYLF